MLVSTTRSLSCFSGAEVEALSPAATPRRIAFTSIGIGPMRNAPERPSPRVISLNCGKRDACHGDNAPTGQGFRRLSDSKIAYLSSYPAKAGNPVRCGPSASLRANGSRECAPDDRLREAIHIAARKEEWIAFASLRNDGCDIVSRSRGSKSPRFAINVAPQNQRAQGRPGARCTRGLACNVHRRTRTRAYRFSGEHPGLPCAVALRLTSCSPR